MLQRIGLLLPRSTDYPAMGYDILDGLKLYLKKQGNLSVRFFSENIGYGENAAFNYAKAEKLLVEDDAELLIVYSSLLNAEPLYVLAETLQKPILFLDAGMQLPELSSSPWCYHISLQGINACKAAGHMAGSGNRKVLMATSFYDGGYRGPWGYDIGLSEAGGSVCGNYVSGYKVADFTIDPYIGLLQETGPDSIAACFSSYLAELFFKALKEKDSAGNFLPFYCSPFMAEEQLLGKCDFPGGEFFTVVPWASSLENEEQQVFTHTLKQEKNKQANIFHLLGWEAGILATQLNTQGLASLDGFTYHSPRGQVVMHADTHATYAPLYNGMITANADGKCQLEITGIIPASETDHQLIMNKRPELGVSGWKNNYLCI